MTHISISLKKKWMMILIVLLILVTSCNNPYFSIGEKLDSSDWIDINEDGGIPFLRSMDHSSGKKGLEVLILEGDILEGDDFGSLTIIQIENGEQAPPAPVRQEITLYQGSYIINGGDISLDLNRMYTLVFQSTAGSIVTESPQKEMDIDETVKYNDLTLSGGITREISFNGNTYRRMDRIVDGIMAGGDAAHKAASIHKLYQVSAIFAPQSRVPGFGGPDMLKYTTPADFGSLMNTPEGDHFMTIQLRQTFRAKTTFTFMDASDLKPFRINGEYESDSDFYGSGPLSGIVDFTLQGSTQSWNCRMDYKNIKVKYTIVESGDYLLSINDGSPVGIPFDNVNPGVLDFSTITLLP